VNCYRGRSQNSSPPARLNYDVLKEPQRENCDTHKGKQKSYNEETQVFEAPALAKLGQSGSAIPVKKC
jgi:hypothetical protein